MEDIKNESQDEKEPEEESYYGQIYREMVEKYGKEFMEECDKKYDLPTPGRPDEGIDFKKVLEMEFAEEQKSGKGDYWTNQYKNMVEQFGEEFYSPKELHHIKKKLAQIELVKEQNPARDEYYWENKYGDMAEHFDKKFIKK